MMRDGPVGRCDRATGADRLVSSVAVTDRHLFLTTTAIAQYVAQIVEKHLAPVGLPVHLLALTTHIRDHQPTSPSAISAASGIPLTTLRDKIERLVVEGLASRVPNPDDRRSYLVTLTTKGEILLRAADPALLDAYVALERHLDRPLEEYQRELDGLAAAFRAALEVEAPATTVDVAAPTQ
jgi:DNA-binding MarR family transcriptional regulator